ncbi:MAG: ComE operon protein 2 [Thermoanaerobacteraceae bacterium]|uniref:ComE operon protein 2 n=1 Tax=Thermanaeromonas sp. C210 TaxID=2731925 RepID=UPI00155CB1AD|nr:ComE operon protein 2 [Thermanaeromonas sp. C210]MBE3580186.1 ComE operon protein 2 [Thermoanaerobacteraceae bacterium]GFN22979.1 ComE operon protein 2 [Thermanaeromonas sp. C210]
MRRLPWHQYFMAQAKLLASRSTCPRLQVGCVITRDKRVVATGYNGSVSGEVHCVDAGCKLEDGHCIRTVHAEANALIQCARFGIATEGAELYVTHFPCLHCVKLILQAGIRHIYYETDYRPHPYALELLEGSAVGVTRVTVSLRDWLAGLEEPGARSGSGEE